MKSSTQPNCPQDLGKVESLNGCFGASGATYGENHFSVEILEGEDLKTCRRV